MPGKLASLGREILRSELREEEIDAVDGDVFLGRGIFNR